MRLMRESFALLVVLIFASMVWAQDQPPKKKILFGIQTGQQDTTYQELVDIWKEAEALGFDSAWNFDHFAPIRGDLNNPCLEGWTLLSALAAHTTKIRIGTLVTGNTYRNPALLAKMATTVDIISGGRLNLGIGAAWFEPEHEAYGFPFFTAKERTERLAESLDVITKLWTVDHPSFAGKFYTLKNAPFNPKPVQQPHPPIVIGGKGKKWVMPLVAKYADGWNVPIGVTPKGIRNRMQIVHDECRRIGRTPCDPEVSAFLILYRITDVPVVGSAIGLGARLVAGKGAQAAMLAGTPKEIIEKIQTYVDAGATHIIVHIEPPYDKEMLRRFVKDVMPAFR
ncbi:MAG TPA: LLM class F420-dependent oxidoreductase [Candidatus Binatia bacterium]|nr:LLM class F420-dependent oxidoreductase [Candidatus Binatia bacterium]